jgi:hypothetical protein
MAQAPCLHLRAKIYVEAGFRIGSKLHKEILVNLGVLCA